MKAVILVGGYGSRLRPLTIDTPKQMLEVVGLTMLERVLDQLSAHGIDEAILALGYLPDLFRDAYPEGTARGVQLSYAVEDEPLDTGGAIRWAAHHLGLDETFLVVNGDVLTDLDIGKLVRFHRESGAEATISLVPVSDPSSFGVVPIDAYGRVLRFIEKPPKDEAPTNLINAGTYIFEPGALAGVTPGDQVSVEREIFPALAAKGTLFALESEEYWIDAGTPFTLLKAGMDILTRCRRAEIPGDKANDSTFIHKDCLDILGELHGCVYLGSKASVGENAVVRSSAVEADAVLEADSTVVNSLVLPGARIGEGSVVHSSIIGPGAVVPPGAIVLEGSVISRHAELSPGCRVEGERIPG